jgi:CDP-6-deoxy-D-xylo-4-hexulose-3-dehydrase
MLPPPFLPGATAMKIPPGIGLAHCDQIMEHGIMLPCHPTLTREDCEYLYQVLEEFIEAKGEVTVTTSVSELLKG